MGVAFVFAVIAFMAVAWNIVSTIMIVSRLQARGEKINFVLIKALAPVYVHRYKKITSEETGRAGPLFYHWIFSINLALAAGIIAVVALIAER